VADDAPWLKGLKECGQHLIKFLGKCKGFF
jgi:hypothetical protein